MMANQLITSLQAEYVNLLREIEKLRKEYEVKAATLERIGFLLNQEDKLRAIRERKLNNH